MSCPICGEPGEPCSACLLVLMICVRYGKGDVPMTVGGKDIDALGMLRELGISEGVIADLIA